MGLLSAIKSIFAKKEVLPTSWDMTITAWSMFPIKALMEQQEPFNEWGNPGPHVPENMRQFWKGSLAQYQLFCFHAVNAATWSQELADQILEIQKLKMNSDGGNWGDTHADGVHYMYNVVKRAVDSPSTVEGADGSQIEVPIEYVLAIDLLVTSADSPYRVVSRDDAIKPFEHEEDMHLAQDLARAKERAMEYWQRAAGIVRFVPEL